MREIEKNKFFIHSILMSDFDRKNYENIFAAFISSHFNAFFYRNVDEDDDDINADVD